MRLSADDMRRCLWQHIELWNAGDKDAWVASWKEFAPNGVSYFEDPIGSPVQSGPDILAEVWDRAPNAGVERMHLYMPELLIGGDTAAALVVNSGMRRGKLVVFPSIELWRFMEDGTMDVRAYWEGSPPEAPGAPSRWTPTAK